MSLKHNIAQVEFFHVGGKDTRSLDALLEELEERVADAFELVLRGGEARSGIKTVVRFFDIGGTLTALALQAEALRRRNREVMGAFLGATGFRRWWFDKRGRRLARKSLALKDKVKTLAAEQLREAIKASRDVAVERLDHSFRPLRKEEAHELVVAAEKARGAWLFVFKPNDLFAYKNAAVAYAM